MAANRDWEELKDMSINVNNMYGDIIVHNYNEPAGKQAGQQGEKPHRDGERPKNEKFGMAVSSLVEDGTLRCKRHFAAICKYVGEGMYEGIGYAAFVRLLAENCHFPEKMMPNENDLKADIITGTYPDWRMPDASDDKRKLYLSYCREFEARMGKL